MTVMTVEPTTAITVPVTTTTTDIGGGAWLPFVLVLVLLGGLLARNPRGTR